MRLRGPFATRRTGPRKNLPERDFEEMVKAGGWLATKRGWPDFLLVRGDDLMMVEVKPRKLSTYPRLGVTQQFMVDILRQHGITVKVWSPDIGFWS